LDNKQKGVLYSSFYFVTFGQYETVNKELNIVFSSKKMGLIKNENQFEGHSNTQVDISSLAKGIYFVQIKTAEGQSVHKLIVE
jgi:hypothetical protein